MTANNLYRENLRGEYGFPNELGRSEDMPKTRDAFALKDFDRARILREYNFSRDKIYRQARAGGYWYFDLPNEHTDDEIVDCMKEDIVNAFERDNYARAQDKLDRLHLRADAVARYQRRILRHLKRLRAYMALRGGATARLDSLVGSYYDIGESLCRLGENFSAAFDDIRATENRYKQLFATRLRSARIAAKMTQSQLARLLGMSQNGYSVYEKGTGEPSLTTQAKIARILNCSADWLLGLT